MNGLNAMKKMITAFVLFTAACTVAAQGVDPVDLLEPLADEWPTYSGDYTGQRYSRLTQLDKDNVQHLTLAWTLRMNTNIRTNGNVVTVQGGEGDGNYLPPGPT